MAASGVIFSEVQRLPLRRAAIMLAIPPCAMLALVIWQVVLGHLWGRNPMSNASVIGWTIFLWILYVRLITVRLVTEVRNGWLSIAMRGFWRTRRIPLVDIASVEVITIDAVRDYGGYGIRSTREGQAYVAGGNEGVRVKLKDGAALVVGSRCASALADILTNSMLANK